MSGPARESGQVNAWLELMAVLTCVALVLTALRPGLAVSLVILSASAAFGAYQLAANTARERRTGEDSAQVHVSRIAGSPNESRWKG